MSNTNSDNNTVAPITNIDRLKYPKIQLHKNHECTTDVVYILSQKRSSQKYSVYRKAHDSRLSDKAMLNSEYASEFISSFCMSVSVSKVNYIIIYDVVLQLTKGGHLLVVCYLGDAKYNEIFNDSITHEVNKDNITYTNDGKVYRFVHEYESHDIISMSINSLMATAPAASKSFAQIDVSDYSVSQLLGRANTSGSIGTNINDENRTRINVNTDTDDELATALQAIQTHCISISMIINDLLHK